MLILGIETSSRTGAVALCDGDLCLGERPLTARGRRHAQTLVAQIGSLLESARRTPRNCAAVAVSHGPGSFTGLRVGIVCAKTFAYATGCRLVAVDTFEAIAENAPADVAQVTVIADAQREELFTAGYVRDPQTHHWVREGEIRIVGAEPFLQALAPDSVLGGPGVQRLAAEATSHLRLLEPADCELKASTIGRLGRRLLEVGRSDDCWTLQPLYLRPSAAEEQWAARPPTQPP